MTSLHTMKDVRDALIELYLSVKVRKSEEIEQYNENDLKEEVIKLQDIDLILLIGYIKTSIEILINLKSDASRREGGRGRGGGEENQSLQQEINEGYNPLVKDGQESHKICVEQIISWPLATKTKPKAFNYSQCKQTKQPCGPCKAGNAAMVIFCFKCQIFFIKRCYMSNCSTYFHFIKLYTSSKSNCPSCLVIVLFASF